MSAKHNIPNLPLHKTFSEEHRQTYGSFAQEAQEFATRCRVYQTPFMYDNVQVGDFYEIDVLKGIEFKADTGFLTITEDRPIAAVTVVGSGCVARGYNIVEWWDEGESIDTVDNRTVKRLRVDDLTGIHPSVWIHILAKVPFLVEQWKEAGIPFNYDHIGAGTIKDDYDLLKKLTLGFSENLPLAFHENSVHFALGHGPVASYPKEITIRCGCKEPEDPGTTLERYPGDYAIRLVQVHVVVPAENNRETECNMTNSDPSLQPVVVNFCPGDGYADAKRSFQGIPGVEIAPNGRLWTCWYSGGPEEGSDNYVVLTTSDDGGATWSEVKLVIDPPGKVRAFDPVLWHDPLGRLWLFWSQSYDLWDGRGGVWGIRAEDSEQENTQWSAPQHLANGVMMNKPLALSAGRWLLPAVVWTAAPKKSIPAEYKGSLPESKTVNVYASDDQGKTWNLHGGAHIPVPKHNSPHALLACEHMLIEKNDHSLWMLVRTNYGIAESFSEDEGQTWSQGRPSAIPHVDSRFFIRRLRSGNLLLVRHDPPGLDQPDNPRHQRSHLKAFLSADDGATWQGGLLLDERKGISYPDGVQAKDGYIYIVYDFQRTGAKEIWMAVFNENDIIAKACGSPQARLRVLVNRATGNEFSPEELQAYVKNCFE